MQKNYRCSYILGYPPCEGNIMVSNPAWCKSYLNFKDDISRWVGTQDMKNFLDLAIFADSFAVAGDKQMLIDLKEFLYSKSTK